MHEDLGDEAEDEEDEDDEEESIRPCVRITCADIRWSLSSSGLSRRMKARSNRESNGALIFRQGSVEGVGALSVDVAGPSKPRSTLWTATKMPSDPLLVHANTP